jgi:two-component system cell cycle response regulator DivK
LVAILPLRHEESQMGEPPVGDQGDRLLALLVDDDVDTREMYGMYLRTGGFRVLIATNGMEAIDSAERERPDVIVMDLMMPRLNGWEAIRRLKRDWRTRRIPIIACTGHVTGSSAERALDAGCDGYVTKPCLPADLLAEIRRVLPPAGA